MATASITINLGELNRLLRDGYGAQKLLAVEWEGQQNPYGPDDVVIAPRLDQLSLRFEGEVPAYARGEDFRDPNVTPFPGEYKLKNPRLVVDA